VAEHFLGIYHENGIATAVDFAQAAAWYRHAAARDYVASIYALGAMHATDRITPRDDVAGLAMLLEAGARAKGDDATSRLVRANQPELVKRMKERMSAASVAEVERRVKERPLRRGLRP
jgi:TPR repeat protein